MDARITVIGIDPGPSESAYILVRGGCLIEWGKKNNEWILAWIKAVHRECSVLIIEQIASFGMPVGSEVFETVFWSGRFAQAWGEDFKRIKRHEVKMHLCQNMRAKDGNIRQALIDRWGSQGTKKAPGITYGISGDVWSALAVATTYLDKG